MNTKRRTTYSQSEKQAQRQTMRRNNWSIADYIRVRESYAIRNLDWGK